MAAMQQHRQSVKTPFGLPKARKEKRVAELKISILKLKAG
jgi:hypothetical protein